MKTEYSINYDAETIKEAQEYLQYRYKQLLKFGVTVRKEIDCGNSIVTLFNSPFGNYYGSIYILKQYRGQQIFIQRLQQFQIAIITLKECNISSYLKKIKCNYIELEHSESYKLIQNVYQDNKAERSKIPFIYHIDEGGFILNKIGASDIVKDSYYLHPLLQSDDEFNKNKSLNFNNINTESLILTTEYRRVANSYLSTMDISSFVGFPNNEIKQMLLADKIQNYKDFLLYHKGTHVRSGILEEYFLNWFKLLEIDLKEVNKFINELK
jgi:hypothetical protein